MTDDPLSSRVCMSSEELHLLELSVQAIKKKHLAYEQDMKDMRLRAEQNQANCIVYKTQLETVTKTLEELEKANENESHIDWKTRCEAILHTHRMLCLSICEEKEAENLAILKRFYVSVSTLRASLCVMETENEELKKELSATKEELIKEQTINDVFSQIHRKKRHRSDAHSYSYSGETQHEGQCR